MAAGTATLTLATLWSGPLGAGAEEDALPPTIEKPKLTLHGIDFTFAAAEARAFKAGDQPVFELTAVNTTDAPVNESICATMTASSAADMLSRVVRMPTILWQQDQIVSLNPKERKTFTLTAGTNLPPRSIISVTLRQSPLPGNVLEKSAPRAGVVALSFSTSAVLVQGLANNPALLERGVERSATSSTATISPRPRT